MTNPHPNFKTIRARTIIDLGSVDGISSKGICRAANIPERAWRNTVRGNGGQFVTNDDLDRAMKVVRPGTFAEAIYRVVKHEQQWDIAYMTGDYDLPMFGSIGMRRIGGGAWPEDDVEIELSASHTDSRLATHSCTLWAFSHYDDLADELGDQIVGKLKEWWANGTEEVSKEIAPPREPSILDSYTDDVMGKFNEMIKVRLRQVDSEIMRAARVVAGIAAPTEAIKRMRAVQSVDQATSESYLSCVYYLDDVAVLEVDVSRPKIEWAHDHAHLSMTMPKAVFVRLYE